METTWIVVASRSEVRVFEMARADEELREVIGVGNASGKLKNIDIDSDAPGRASDNRMRARHAYSTEQEPRERLLENFYRAFLREIDTAFSQHKFSRLVLVAEPRLLGLVRSLLSVQLSRAIKAEIAKDVVYEGSREIQARVRSVL
jgi:protein required for attachment to host cells